MSFSPVRLGSLIVTAVIAAGVVAQAASGQDSGTAADQVVGRPAGGTATVAPGTHTIKPSTHNARTPSPTRHTQKKGSAQRAQKVVFLTFDDGPTELYTPTILKILAKYHAKATFFQLGLQVKEFPGLPAKIRAAGHTIGNHTYDHKFMPALTPAKVRWELQHGPKSRCFRPPFRATNKQIAAIAKSYGMRQILWTIDTEDWKKPGTSSIEQQLLSAQPGSVILMHDGGGEREQTIAALDRGLSKLSRRGYTFKSLDC